MQSIVKMIWNALRTRPRSSERKRLRQKLTNPGRRGPIVPKNLHHRQHRRSGRSRRRRRLQSATSHCMVVRLGWPFGTITTATSRARFRMAPSVRRRGLELYQLFGGAATVHFIFDAYSLLPLRAPKRKKVV